MLIAQITDMHLKGEGELLFGRVDTTGFLDDSVSSVCSYFRYCDEVASGTTTLKNSV